MKYICASCGSPTDNMKMIGSIECHTCDSCLGRLHKEIDWQCKGEQWRENTVICPYCDHKYDSYDAYEYDEGEHEEVECEICGKKFDIEVEDIRYYSTKRSVCEMPKDYSSDDEEA